MVSTDIENKTSKENSDFTQEVNFHQIVEMLWNSKISISIFAFCIFLISIIATLSMQDIYESKAILSPTEKRSQPSVPTNILGLAGITGLNIVSGGSGVDEGIEILKSYNFFKNFLETGSIKENLFALKKWDKRSNTLIYDEKLFDSKEGIWKVDSEKIPSSQEAFVEFQKIFSISQDPKTSFVTLTINHPSPSVAKDWLDRVIYLINETTRKAEAEEARKSIDYLMIQMEQTDFTEVKKVLSELVKNQLQIAMLADSNPDFLFKVIEPPIVPEEKKSPQRAILVLLITLIGSLLYSLALIVYNLKQK